jgi:hypothetical protein
VTKPEEPNAEPSEFGDETASLAGAVTSTGATSGDAGSGGDGRVTGNDEAGSGGDGRVTGSDAVAIGSDAIATGGEAGDDGERSNWCMKAGMEPLAIDGSKSVPIDESEPLMTVVPLLIPAPLLKTVVPLLTTASPVSLVKLLTAAPLLKTAVPLSLTAAPPFMCVLPTASPRRLVVPAPEPSPQSR